MNISAFVLQISLHAGDSDSKGQPMRLQQQCVHWCVEGREREHDGGVS